MLAYVNGSEIMLGDSVLIERGRTAGTVVELVQSDQIADFNVDEGGVMIKSAPFGLVFYPISSFFDIVLVKRSEI